MPCRVQFDGVQRFFEVKRRADACSFHTFVKSRGPTKSRCRDHGECSSKHCTSVKGGSLLNFHSHNLETFIHSHLESSLSCATVIPSYSIVFDISHDIVQPYFLKLTVLPSETGFYADDLKNTLPSHKRLRFTVIPGILSLVISIPPSVTIIPPSSFRHTNTSFCHKNTSPCHSDITRTHGHHLPLDCPADIAPRLEYSFLEYDNRRNNINLLGAQT